MSRRLLREFIESVVVEAIRSKSPVYKWKDSPRFDLTRFKKLPNESIMLAYAMNYLEVLGQGSSRIVFVLTSRKVIKLAKNPKGISQNNAELKVYTDPATSDIAAKIHDADDKGMWLISELVRPLTSESEFERLSGVEWKEFMSDLEATISSDVRRAGKHELRPDAAPFTKKVHKMAEKGLDRLKLGDLTVIDHWGKTPDGRVVLLDYGFTEEVALKHYDKESRRQQTAAAADVKTGR